MRWKAASAPRRRSSSPASSAVTCAASCCKPLALLPHPPVGPATHREPPRPSVLGLQAKRSPRASRRCWLRLASRASLLRAACAVHSCKPPLDALRLGLHLLQRRALVGGVALGQPPLFAARLQLRGQLFDGPGQRRGFRLRLRQARFQFASRPSASRNSRFSASGPSLAGLPPVTVALWKHSPSGVRK
jgi:hypothetical protein